MTSTGPIPPLVWEGELEGPQVPEVPRPPKPIFAATPVVPKVLGLIAAVEPW